MNRILAIDPGVSGGFAWLEDGRIQTLPMLKTDGDIICHINHLLALSPNWAAVIEEVGGYCGGAGAPGSAMFNFGNGYGFIRGVLMARGFRVELVKPQKWQKHFGFGTVKSSGGKTAWKNKLKGRAQQLFPNADVTLKTADALLIYEYAHRNGLAN